MDIAVLQHQMLVAQMKNLTGEIWPRKELLRFAICFQIQI